MTEEQIRRRVARKLARAKDWKMVRLERKEQEEKKKREGKNELEN